jgi:hypothetical protein
MAGILAAVLLLLACAPDVPHAVGSKTDNSCLVCHSGRAGAPKAHDKTGCVSCHDASTVGTYPTLMSHRGGEADRCSLCHVDGTAKAPVTKHIRESDCYTCHQAPEYGTYPPAVAHALDSTDRASCLGCHQDLDHSERELCLTCHEP